jgi:predicted  nucleic acid-binding Zn-ribbon protein
MINKIINSTENSSLKGFQTLPCQPKDVPDYIWYQILPELVKNQGEYPSDSAYQAAVEQLKKDYLAARDLVAKGQFPDDVIQQLENLINHAISLTHYPNKPLSPQEQKAQELINDFTKKIKDLESQEGGLKAEEKYLLAELKNLQNQLDQLKNIPDFAQKYAGEIQQIQNAMNQVQDEIAAIQNQFSSIVVEENTFENELNELVDYQSEMEQTDDPSALDQYLNEIISLIQDAEPSIQDCSNQIALHRDALSKIDLTSIQNQIQDLQNKAPIVPPVHTDGSTTYLDFGLIQAGIMKYINWSTVPATVDEKGLLHYFDSLFAQLKAAGITQVDLAFSQLADVGALLSGDLSNVSAHDTIAQILQFSNQYLGGFDLISLFTKEAHAQGLSVDLSFGGLFGDHMQICPNGEDPHDQAVKMAAMMQKYGFDSIDFDLESGGAQEFMSQGVDVVKDYLKTLHTLLEAQNKTMTLTVMGDVNTWGKNVFAELFSDKFGHKTFSDYFDGLNLMLYSDTDYYLDADNSSWGLKQWIDVIGQENISKMHIGFDDGVPYESPSASQGSKNYPIDPTSRGRSAALIYKEIIKQLHEMGIEGNFGEPFWWPATEVNGGARYLPDANGNIQFGIDVAMQEFYDEMNS